jgi:hypothetical protein
LKLEENFLARNFWTADRVGPIQIEKEREKGEREREKKKIE